MLDLAELTWGRYNGGATAPIGTYVNLRTMEYFQQTADGTLPVDGTLYRTNPLGTESASTIATTLNTTLGTAYTSGSLHAAGSSDHTQSQGTASDDA